MSVMDVDTALDDSVKMSCFEMNLHFNLVLLMDDYGWRRRGERYRDTATSKLTDREAEVSSFGAKCMPWKGDNLVLHLYPIGVHPDLHIVQQDSARAHAARLAMQVLTNARTPVLESPDVSPIEHLWDEL